MKKLTLFLLLLGLCLGAQAQSLTPTALKALISTNVTASGSDKITGAKLRAVLNALVDNMGTSTGGSSSTATVASRYVPLIIMTGESNAAGYGLNSGATSTELSVRPAVKIYHNTALQFQSLQVGVNNWQDMAFIDNTRHGFELELANRATANSFLDNPIYILKTGQGGALLSNWTVGSSYWNKFSVKVDSAKAQIRRMGKIPLVYVVLHIGINNYNTSTSATDYRTQLTTHVRDLRTKLGRSVPILFPRFMGTTYASYNTVLDSLAKNDGLFYTISSAGATVASDNQHWTYAGYKIVAGNIADFIINGIGEHEAYVQTQLNSGSVTYVATTTGSSSTTSSGGSVGGSSACSGISNVGSWTNLTNATVGSGAQGSNYLQPGTTPSGALVGNTSVNAQSCFEIITDLDNGTGYACTYLSESQSDDYNVSAKDFLGMIVNVGSAVYYQEGSTLGSQIGSALFPGKLKLSSTGNGDLVYSVNSGNGWTVLRTSTGRLSGKTTLYVKGGFVISGATPMRVTVNK